MASPTYSARVIVLRKTKLSESDLILTMLSSDGSQIRSVAKGARKPSSPFSSRLELFSSCDVLLARGRNLDIVKEARLVSSCEHIRRSVERASCAAPAAEVLERVSEQGLCYPKLFDMTQTALCALDRCTLEHAPAICAAHLLKAFAFTGFLPTFSRCCICGGALDARGSASFSMADGGAICPACSSPDAIVVPAVSLTWGHALLHAKFSQVAEMEIDQASVFSVLHLAQGWSTHHLSSRLKSLEFLVSCGLF